MFHGSDPIAFFRVLESGGEPQFNFTITNSAIPNVGEITIYRPIVSNSGTYQLLLGVSLVGTFEIFVEGTVTTCTLICT